MTVPPDESHPKPIRYCWGPQCNPRQALLPRQRRFCSRRCRLDSKNAKRNASPDARREAALAVQRHRIRTKLVDPFRRYFIDAAREVVHAYGYLRNEKLRLEALQVFRQVEREIPDPKRVRRIVRALVHDARKRGPKQSAADPDRAPGPVVRANRT